MPDVNKFQGCAKEGGKEELATFRTGFHWGQYIYLAIIIIKSHPDPRLHGSSLTCLQKDQELLQKGFHCGQTMVLQN